MVKIALAQISASEDPERNMEKALRMLDEAARREADIIAYPEVGLNIFFPKYRADPKYFELAEQIPGPTTARLQQKASETGVAVVVSLLEREMEGVYYDSAAVIDNDGALLGVQRMMHIAEEPNYNEKFYYKPGNSDYPVFKTRKARVGVAICQDLFFPEMPRILALKGAEVILVPTAVSAETDPLFIASQAAAALNQVFVGVANRVGREENMTFIGNSHAVNPNGEIIARSQQKSDDLVVADLDIDYLRNIRRTQNYWFRDRRPETYTLLTKLNVQPS